MCVFVSVCVRACVCACVRTKRSIVLLSPLKSTETLSFFCIILQVKLITIFGFLLDMCGYCSSNLSATFYLVRLFIHRVEK